MSEPKYITELKKSFNSLSLNVTDRFARIETTLDVLPKIEKHLDEINDSVAENKQTIALVKQRQDECPARLTLKNSPIEQIPDSVWSTATYVITKFGFAGLLIVIVIMLLLIMAKQQCVF